MPLSEETRRLLREAKEQEAGMTFEQAGEGLQELPPLPTQPGETVVVGVSRPEPEAEPAKPSDDESSPEPFGL